MKRVVRWSGGLCSFWAAHRVWQEFGPSDMVLLFANVLIEDPSLYIFNRRASELLGVPITELCFGETPLQLFKRQGLIGNARFPICSVILKREMLDKWVDQNCGPDDVHYIGFEWTEPHRLEHLRVNKPQYHWEAPMTLEPIWDKCRMVKEAEALKLPISPLYDLGFPHNNCGGRCVKAGISHWVHLYRVLPERYMEWALEEDVIRKDFKVRGIESDKFTILKDRRGGTTKPLSLLDLKTRIEAGESFPRDDWGGCGCGSLLG